MRAVKADFGTGQAVISEEAHGLGEVDILRLCVL